MKCEATYLKSNEWQCYRLASCIAQPSHADEFTITVFFLLNFVFFSPVEWVYYFTFASHFVFVESLVKLRVDDFVNQAPNFIKQEPALTNSDPYELFFPQE
jgi:hypothetical protein